MVDVRGVGVLIRGKSGVGKSETALGLIERGAALVADDMVYVRNVGGELVASAPEMSRGFMEVRGLGIVNITTLFGLKSIRHNKRLDLIVTLIPAKDQEALDRLGLEREGLDVLGEKVLHVQLSVAPGRDPLLQIPWLPRNSPSSTNSAFTRVRLLNSSNWPVNLMQTLSWRRMARKLMERVFWA